MDNAKSEIAKGEYIIGIAVILAALLVSATIYIAAGNLTDALAKKNFAVNVQQAAAAPSGNNAVAPTQPTQPTEPAPINIDVTGKPFRGGANAKVLIVEYSDFQCPFCDRVNPTVDQVLSTYGNDVKLVYKHFPLESLHPNAEKAAEASECARDQGKFWEMHDAMFADQNGLDNAGLKAKAVTIGLNATSFNSCLDGGSKLSIVSAEAQEGADNGVSGTPTFYINGKQVVGAQPFSAFKQVIDAALAG